MSTSSRTAYWPRGDVGELWILWNPSEQTVQSLPVSRRPDRIHLKVHLGSRSRIQQRDLGSGLGLRNFAGGGSEQNLTGYDNSEPSHTCNATGCVEFYRFAPGAGHLNCVSCAPTGARPTGPAQLGVLPGKALTSSRNISTDGQRVFFESPDRLVAQDTNGVEDPYEWEALGVGSCHVEEVAEGCLYLL